MNGMEQQDMPIQALSFSEFGNFVITLIYMYKAIQ